MQDVEGIEAAAAKLRPHRAAIEKHFEHENRIFIGLTSSPHDTLGRVLKCHLIVEHYLNRFLVAHFGIDNFDEVRLTFLQKANLIPDRATALCFVKLGIVRLNQIRNQFCHSLGAEISETDVRDSMRTVLKLFRSEVHFKSPIETIEAFTTLACTFMIVFPADLQQAVTESFKLIKGRVDAPE